MKFGLFFTMDHYPELSQSPDQHLQDIVEQVHAAEVAGFDSVWFTEQHLNPMDGLCPDPILMMTYIAAKTTAIRIGSAVTLAALYNPVHLAEAYAFLDTISGGRVDIGLGASSLNKTFEAYGVPFESRRQMRDTTADELISLWGGSGVSLADNANTVVPSGIRLGIYPLQKPNPPIWIATGAIDRIETILASGHNILFDYLFSDFSAAQAVAKKTAFSTKHGGNESRITGVVYTQLVHTDTAFSHFKQYYNDFLTKLRGPGFDIRDEWSRLDTAGQILCCSVSEAKLRVENIASQNLDQLLLGVGFGGVPHEEVLDTIEVFSRQIMSPHRERQANCTI